MANYNDGHCVFKFFLNLKRPIDLTQKHPFNVLVIDALNAEMAPNQAEGQGCSYSECETTPWLGRLY
jgi:hypothetical protein